MSERAWLVEWRFNGVQWLYLWARAPGGFSFTGDASKALRFARREDAEAALQWARDADAARRPIGSLTRHGLALGEMLVTEHDWPALTAAPSAQAEPQEPPRSAPLTEGLASDMRSKDGGPRFRVGLRGAVLDDDDFIFDALIRIEGDFASEEQRERYARWIADTLNAADEKLPRGISTTEEQR